MSTHESLFLFSSRKFHTSLHFQTIIWSRVVIFIVGNFPYFSCWHKPIVTLSYIWIVIHVTSWCIVFHSFSHLHYITVPVSIPNTRCSHLFDVLLMDQGSHHFQKTICTTSNFIWELINGIFRRRNNTRRNRTTKITNGIQIFRSMTHVNDNHFVLTISYERSNTVRLLNRMKFEKRTFIHQWIARYCMQSIANQLWEQTVRRHFSLHLPSSIHVTEYFTQMKWEKKTYTRENRSESRLFH